MPSEVQICNLALAHLGDSATVASINPPEGSAQAEHCSRFYPIARDTLLEDTKGKWSFAVKRASLAQLASAGNSKWLYAYAMPQDFLRAISLTHPSATDDQIDDATVRTAEQYVMESRADGQVVIRTDVDLAELRYVYRVTDTNKFSNSFAMALSWRLASLLAGPVIKGDAGRKQGQFCEGMSREWLGKASEIDASQSYDEMGPISSGYIPYHLANR